MGILPGRDGIAKVLLLGRANVGKSTLFNRLARRRIAIIDDVPHTTRDFLNVEIEYKDTAFTLIDAAGFLDDPEAGLQRDIRLGLEQAIMEADLIIFLLDAESGPVTMDRDLLDLLRRNEKRYIGVVNKIPDDAGVGESADFYALGFDDVLVAISAKSGYGCRVLLTELGKRLTVIDIGRTETEKPNEDEIAVAVVGRPNVGKSTLINKLIGDDRVLVDDVAGTTRDAVDISMGFEGNDFVLVDTAGIRRMSKRKDYVEEYSMAKAFSAVKRSDVVLLVLDAADGPTAQDARIAGYAYDRGKGILIFLNKADLLDEIGKTEMDRIEDIRIKYKYLQYAPLFTGSAIGDDDLSSLLTTCADIAENRKKRIETARLNKTINSIMRNRRFTSKGKEVKILYAAQVGIEPPKFRISVNLIKEPHFSFRRFVENQIRGIEDFTGTPLWFEYTLREKRGSGR
ncbi:MAG: ribosome biogenesis GTPase Der [bacterium]|nr:ribosome biogenesis GTPase Der [bacterium]